MIDWRDINLNDKSDIDRLVTAADCRSAEFSFANLFIWRNTYRMKIAFAAGFMLIYIPYFDLYAYPVGDGNISEALELLTDEAHSRGRKLRLRGLTDTTRSELESLYPGRFSFTEDRDNADYIYTTEKLCELPGRHMASKRNHIHRFVRAGEWELRRVSTGAASCSSLDEARAFVAEFYREKNDPDLVAEAGAIEEMFSNFDALGFRSAILYQNGKPVAWSAGTLLTPKVFDTHFEKALPGADGAYSMINREFARMIRDEVPQLELFNREEDMGLEGLRRAKESYRPDILLMKYTASEI